MIWKYEGNWAQRKYFRHCRFKKGGGSSTTVQSYQPTAEEKRLWTQQADYVDKVAPNALALNDYAMNLLKDSLGTVQVDYNTMNQTAQDQIKDAMGAMGGLAGSNSKSANTTNDALKRLDSQTNAVANNTANAYGNLTNEYANTANVANKTLGGLGNQSAQIANTAAAGYDNLAKDYTGAANTANATLSQLANGNVPSAYQQNMENSIQSALNNTIGKTVSNLGNRGILNSSVTSSAMNDIEKNAADTVAQQYQQNINQAAGLAQQQYGNTTDAANSLGQLIGNKYNTQDNAISRQGGLAQQQYSNNLNTVNAKNDIVGKQNDALTNALNTQYQSAQQRNENTQGANSQNSGIYSNLINSATAPITTAATAQDAAITPAQSLWNTSLGLNGAGTSALGVMGGKGTTTSTQTYNTGGGGGFFSGLLGGVANGYANALGGSLFCFPAGTMISMADGTEKDIKHISEGDMVISDDGSEVEVVEVMKPHYNDVYNIVCENGHTSTTLTQPLMKPNGDYIFAADLKIGTELKRVGKVKSIIYSGERKVYDFKTSGENNYIADGFVAMGGDGSIWGR